MAPSPLANGKPGVWLLQRITFKITQHHQQVPDSRLRIAPPTKLTNPSA